jgi:[pyruvate, water dikinase]-phosphate phosphotransferase / [pyruvate, water dikinase] kinase
LDEIMTYEYHLHLVSDATGETLNTVAKAVCAQFEEMLPREHIYSLVRSERQLQRAVAQIASNPGVVFYTLVNTSLREMLEQECRKLGVPSVSILDRPTQVLGKYLGAKESHRPGGQHEVDSRYLERVEALNFAIQHDDGQNTHDLNAADVVLVGASRSSKTPTCVYLAIRGIRAANIPLVPGVEPPELLFSLTKPLVVGLWLAPERLMHIRRNRLVMMGEVRSTDYVDDETIRAEIQSTRRLFEKHDWPSIDVSRRSVEETAAAIINLLSERGNTA